MPRTLRYDRGLCMAIVGLTFFGLLMVFSATAGVSSSPRYIIKQTVAAALGLFFMRVLMYFDYRRLGRQKFVFLTLGGAIILLLVALLINDDAPTRRFLSLGFFSFQPSEAAKLALILFLAVYLERTREKINRWGAFLGVAAIVGVLCGLIVAGRDLGTAVSLALIAAGVLWVAGLRMRFFVVSFLVMLLAAGAAIWMEPYRWDRIVAFLNPDLDPMGSGYQIRQSEIAVGTGGLLGRGLMEGRQKMLFLPAAHTDFIFAVICEELGLLGAAAVAFAFLMILFRGLSVAYRARDPLGRYLAAGVTGMIVFQAMINVCVVLGMLPTKGLPLPFISYGGTAMICSLAGAGILLNVSQHAD